MNKKLYPMYLKSLTAVFGMAVASTLIGCQATNTQKQTTDTQTTETSQDAQTNTDSNYNDVKDYLQTKQEKDTEAEAAISIMLDGAEKLKDSASDAANSEEVKQQLSHAMDNFKVLSDFIFNGGEIDGVTFSELSDEGKENAKNALNSLDNTLNELIPNYKERFKEWFTDNAAKGLDALDSLKDKGSELWNEIQTKRKTKK